ncbi:MAG: phosphate/phosphite/phosphonate ABC transporter substrate-binding protein [Bdellovibrionaceae bacterium]|nr:phosphate/phosphite/phosphonate ABC transporter substrate-binding protein [Pseudobdellovibrionaceae bacterium]
MGESPLGSARNPIKISLVPGQNPKTLEVNGEKMAAFLEKEVGLRFQVNVPISFITVVEALGTKRADMALMNTFGYLLANEKNGARVRLIGLYNNTDVYHGQIIAHADGPKKLKDLNGKKVAFVDPASGSGYLLALKLFREENIVPKEIIFAGRHDSVALMVYQRRVDAGATYHALPDKGVPQDARKIIQPQHPDVFEKVRILAKTGPIPNDPVVFRKDFPIDLQEKIVAAMKKYIRTPEGADVMEGLYHMNGFRDASEKDFDGVRRMLLDLGKSSGDFVK